MKRKRGKVQELRLWEFHFVSEYYDNDPRMPGFVPVNEHVYVVASDYDKAMKKAEPELKKLKDRWTKANKGEDKSEVKASVVPFENLIACRDAARERPGAYKPFVSVNLSTEEDHKNYRLAVVLLPIKYK